MNIQMQLAGLGILLLLLCFYARRKSVGLYTEIFFRRTMWVTLINVTMDISSIIAIVNRDRIPDWLCFTICKTYLVTLVGIGCCGLLYICQDIYRGSRLIRVQCGFGLAALVGSFLICVFPIQIYSQDDVSYTYGASVITTYIFCLSFVILTLVMAIYHRKQMNRKRVEAVVIWILVWMCAAVVQFLFNQLLLVGYAACIGMVILFFELENPEANLDRETGAFNSHVLHQYMGQLYDRKQKFYLLLIGRKEHRNDADLGGEASLMDVARFLEGLDGTKVFKNVEHEFVVLCEDPYQFEAATEKILERFGREWNGRLFEPIYISIKDSEVADSSDEIQQLLRYYKQNYTLPDDSRILERFGRDWNGRLLEPIYISIKDSEVADSSDEIQQLLRYYKQNYTLPDNSRILEINREMVEERRQWVQMYKTIVNALKEDRVAVFLQPIYSVEKDRFLSAEALVRILDADGSIVPPGRFISVAEETGLIEQLGERVFEKVCQFIQRERMWEWGMEYIEVNLSVRQCESRTLAEHYQAVMEQYGVKPSMINLEVTESASIRMRNIFMQNMEKLIDYGVSFSLDDFGSGQSNLNYIVDMPVEIVKFDRDMTKAYFEKSKGKLVMETAMRMILDLGLKIVSEGVETEEQLETMKKLGVQYIQGYYFSKPLPEDEFVRFVKEKNKI